MAEEVYGISQDVILGRATDDDIRAAGQDGGAVSAMLAWALEHSMIDAALVSSTVGNDVSGKPDTGSTDTGSTDTSSTDTGSTLGSNTPSPGSHVPKEGASTQGQGKGAAKPLPAFVTDRQGILDASGSRYTYSTNTLAYNDAVAAGYERLAIVGTGCQASMPAVMNARKAGKVGRRLMLSIGLLCSKTFDDSIYPELFEAGYGIMRNKISKINIKGRFQVWMEDGSYSEVPLKEGQKWTRDGCKLCPDFSAEHADVSAGGIGGLPGWTLLIIRTDTGKQLVEGALSDGVIETRSIMDDPAALNLLAKLSRVSRKRWPQDNHSYREPGQVATG
ncbi:MAG: Coenzyme F420 hydrogenase/dehydrogenase, beta subunit C-terminal domain [Actinobacteria bacterium]|nr:Coenzyme F420 hydrogenase/dehydrogenase, beta subunit C-terminal domain [Actinomycetota bacterium]